METPTDDSLRIRDAKSSVVDGYTVGVVCTASGAAILIHSRWHGFDPQLLLLGVLIFILGAYLTYRAKQQGMEKFHQMTKALFPKPA